MPSFKHNIFLLLGFVLLQIHEMCAYRYQNFQKLISVKSESSDHYKKAAFGKDLLHPELDHVIWYVN